MRHQTKSVAVIIADNTDWYLVTPHSVKPLNSVTPLSELSEETFARELVALLRAIRR
jgi:hypothetical protein